MIFSFLFEFDPATYFPLLFLLVLFACFFFYVFSIQSFNVGFFMWMCHFLHRQGCPSTLGASRKSQDLFQRVPARDKHIRALFTEKVINRIEKDAGCKIKMDEKFIIVSGKDNSCLTKGLDAVHKVIQDEGKTQDSSTSHRARSRSPDRSPAGPQLRRSESHRSNPSPRKAPHVQPKFTKSDRVVEDRLREDLKHMSRRSPQGRDNIQYLYVTNIILVNPVLALSGIF